MNLKDYGAKNFWLTEFIPKEVYNVLGDKSVHLMDKRIFVIWQVIRNYIETPVTLNTWYDGGKLNERGFRVYNTKTGAKESYHKLGKATDGSWDFNIKSIDVVLGHIILNRHLFIALGLGGVGIYPWGLHLDTRDLVNGELTTWKG